MSTPSSTRTHVCFNTPHPSDILATPSSGKKKLFLSESSLTTPIKLTYRKSFGTNAETDICSTKVSINKNFLKRPSSDFLDNLERTREDAYGTFIIKGRKNHKVTFIDNISNQNIAEVILVDNLTSMKSAKDTCECKCSTGCIIF